MNQLYFKKNNDVKVCYDKLCVNAKGKNAELITNAVAFSLVCLGIGAILRSIK
jgi:hypothetical protein